MHPKISSFHKSVILDISPSTDSSFFLFFHDTKSILHNDRHFTEMKGNQHSCCASNKISHEEMQAKKLITYHFFASFLLKHTGLPSVARLQREEVSRRQQEA
jgi:hypothetical protein